MIKIVEDKNNIFYWDGKSEVPENVVNAIIKDGVTEINSSAFENCTSLKSIEIPDSITEIGEYAFAFCKSLTSVTIPDSVTSIGEYAFAFCKSLTSVTIPDSIRTIEKYAFCQSGLTSVIIPDSVTSIGNYAFSMCYALTSVTIPDSVTSIGKGAFYKCTNLKNIKIPDSVTEIGEGAFENTPINKSNNSNDYNSSNGLVNDAIEFLKCTDNIYSREEYYELMSDSENWDYYDENEIEGWKKYANQLLKAIRNPSSIYFVSEDDEEGTYTGENDYTSVFSFISNMEFMPDNNKKVTKLSIDNDGTFDVIKSGAGSILRSNIMGYHTIAMSLNTAKRIISYLRKSAK